MTDDMLKHLHPISSSGLRNQIAEQIRTAILNSSLKPGDHIIESAVAEQLQLSRAPVREALAALEREGIIVYVSRRGYSVVEFTPKDIEEIYSLRLMLEIGALRRAFDRFTEADYAKMQQLVDSIGDGIEAKLAQSELSNLDLAFHELICKGADNSRLFSVWDRMRMQICMLIGMTAQTHYEHPQNSKQFHQKILDAIVARDLERTEMLLSRHIVDAQKRALQHLNSLSTEKEDPI